VLDTSFGSTGGAVAIAGVGRVVLVVTVVAVSGTGVVLVVTVVAVSGTGVVPKVTVVVSGAGFDVGAEGPAVLDESGSGPEGDAIVADSASATRDASRAGCSTTGGGAEQPARIDAPATTRPARTERTCGADVRADRP
jgi:hypothetical protein